MTEKKQEKEWTGPLPFSIYKGIGGKQGAIRFKLVKSKRKKRVAHFVLLEAAKTIGKNKYDWDNVIVFALNQNDLGGLLYALENEASFESFHDPHKGSENQGKISKSLKLTPAEGRKGVFFLNLMHKEASKDVRVGLAINTADVQILKTLLKHALIKMFDW